MTTVQEEAIPYIVSDVKKKEVIENDAQTIEQDSSDIQKKFPYDPTKADIDIREDKVSIYEYMRRYKRGILKIDPDYQRNLVWSSLQKSRFIESIMLNFPLPPIYLNQQIDGKFVIIDGLQRTTTLNQFINNEFPLVGLKTLPDWNNHYFKDMLDYQAKIEDKQLQLYILKPSVPISVVYELFDRINTGGTALNRQEVRNCIFEGEATRLLKELAENPDYGFRQAIDNGVSPTRMKDREIILRYLSFKIFDYEKDYDGDLSDFLERAMSKINNFSEDEINNLKADFHRVMRWTYLFFGNNNFRFPILSNETGAAQSRGFINTSMFESISYFFSKQSDEFLEKNKTKIISNYNHVLLNSNTYIDAVRSATGSKLKVANRFKIAQQILGNIS